MKVLAFIKCIYLNLSTLSLPKCLFFQIINYLIIINTLVIHLCDLIYKFQISQKLLLVFTKYVKYINYTLKIFKKKFILVHLILHSRIQLLYAIH